MSSPSRSKPPKHDPGDGVFVENLLRPLIKTVFRKPYADLTLMEGILRDNGLD